MPSTARLLAAQGNEAIHAHKPAEDDTLCGLSVVHEEDLAFEVGDSPDEIRYIYPPRSADFTGRRFYTGVYRLMCQRCVHEAPKARAEMLGVPLEEVK